MPYYEFGQNDIFHNEIETHPSCSFFFVNGAAYFNRTQPRLGEFDPVDIPNHPPSGVTFPAQNVTHVPSGYLSLHELNIDRKLSDHDYDAETESGDETMIYPFITKGGSLTSFKTVSTSTFQGFNYGTIMTGSYPMSASVTTEHYYASGSSGELVDCYGDVRRHLRSLKNTLNNYLYLSREYSYKNYDEEEVRLVNIPSIFYGSHIEKGTVELKVYYKGELVAKLSDYKKNGELIQTYPETVEHCGLDPHPDYGKVAGVVLYTEGFILLTGSWDMDAPNYVGNNGGFWLTCPECQIAHDPEWNQPWNPVALPLRWIYFASLGDEEDRTCNDDPNDLNVPSKTLNPDFTWSLDFKGTNFVPVMTMLAHAPKGELNHSNNPTFVQHGQNQTPKRTETEYIEKSELVINNTVKSPYNDPDGNFRKQTWISKIGIYDEDKNLIGIVKLATPVRKTEEGEFTFKLKLDF